ncbi:MAG TPA: hypothetical protein VFE05_18545 [Longimicrobiaceae bacterium]|jgi:hypothetical protein|nr:hypothetical protein [Longimicrobiaceae bacterium]
MAAPDASTHVYRPEEYGAAGDGVTDDWLALGLLIHEVVPASGGTVVVSRAHRVAHGDLVVPANVALRFEPGGWLVVDAGREVRLHGAFAAGALRVFGGAGRVGFGKGARPTILPQWWGALGDGAADDTVALRAALAALPPEGGRVRVPPGTYRLTGTARVAGKADFTVDFEPGAWLRQEGGSGYALEVSACGRWVLRNPRIYVEDRRERPAVEGGIRVTDGSPRGLLHKPVVCSMAAVPPGYVALSVEDGSSWTEIHDPSVRKCSPSLGGAFAAGVRLARGCDASRVVGGEVAHALQGVVVESCSGVTVDGTAFEDVVSAMVLAPTSRPGASDGFSALAAQFRSVGCGLDIRFLSTGGGRPPFLSDVRPEGAAVLVRNPQALPCTVIAPTPGPFSLPASGPRREDAWDDYDGDTPMIRPLAPRPDPRRIAGGGRSWSARAADAAPVDPSWRTRRRTPPRSAPN